MFMSREKENKFLYLDLENIKHFLHEGSFNAYFFTANHLFI